MDFISSGAKLLFLVVSGEVVRNWSTHIKIIQFNWNFLNFLQFIWRYNLCVKSCRQQKKRNSERDIWRNSWGSNHSQKSSCSLQSNFTTNYIGKDDFWLALQPNYNFIMDTKLLDTCREARGELEHSRREETNHAHNSLKVNKRDGARSFAICNRAYSHFQSPSIAVARREAKRWIHCRSETFEMLVTPYAKWTIEIPFDFRCHKNERLWTDETAKEDFGKWATEVFIHLWIVGVSGPAPREPTMRERKI